MPRQASVGFSRAFPLLALGDCLCAALLSFPVYAALRDASDVDPRSPLLFLDGSYGGTMGYLGLARIVFLGTVWLAAERRRPTGGSSQRARRSTILCGLRGA